MNLFFLCTDHYYDQFVTHQLDLTLGDTVAQAGTTSLTGYVKKGQTLRLLDLLDFPQMKRLSAINIRLQKIVSDCEAKYLDIYTAPSSQVYTLLADLCKDNQV